MSNACQPWLLPLCRASSLTVRSGCPGGLLATGRAIGVCHKIMIVPRLTVLIWWPRMYAWSRNSNHIRKPPSAFKVGRQDLWHISKMPPNLPIGCDHRPNPVLDDFGSDPYSHRLAIFWPAPAQLSNDFLLRSTHMRLAVPTWGEFYLPWDLPLTGLTLTAI